MSKRKSHRVALKSNLYNDSEYKKIKLKLSLVLIALGVGIFLDGVIFGYLISKFSQRNKV